MFTLKRKPEMPTAAEALPGLLTPLGWTFWDTRVELALRLGIVGADSCGARRNRDRAVHRASVDVLEAEHLGQAPGNGRFARADRPGSAWAADGISGFLLSVNMA